MFFSQHLLLLRQNVSYVHQVEVFFHRLGEIYVAPSGGGEALVSALLYQDGFRRDGLFHLLRLVWLDRGKNKHALSCAAA